MPLSTMTRRRVPSTGDELGAVLRDVRVVDPSSSPVDGARLRVMVLRGTVVLATGQPPPSWGPVAPLVDGPAIRDQVIDRLERHARRRFDDPRRTRGAVSG